MDNENKSYGFGTENQQEGTQPQGYGETQSEQTYGQPEQQFGEQTYGQPEQQSGEQTYGQPEQTYGQPEQQFGEQTYGQPEQQFGEQTYGQPEQQFGEQTYGQPEQQFGGQTYGQPEQQFGGQTYGQPEQQFGGQTYGQPNQQFGEQTYGQPNQQFGNQTYGQPNYGMGPVPLGKNGQPLKNNFGMKMTFSILEILCCCGCNVVTMIMGIIGCVFTSGADKAYKEGRWDEFKSKSRTASICLWVGLGIAVLYLIIGIAEWTVGGGREEFYEAFEDSLSEYYGTDVDDSDDDSDFDYDFDYDNDDSDDDYDFDDDYDAEPEDAEAPVEPLEVTAGEGFTDPSITIEGITVQLPLSYPELVELGFSIDPEDEEYIANKNEYYEPTLYGPDGEDIGYVYIGNATESPLALKDGIVFGFWFSSSSLSYGDVSVSFANGLNENATKEDFMTAYGEPDYAYESESGDYQSYQWYNHSDEYYDMDENSLSVQFWEGELDDLEIMYIGWD